MDRIRVGINGFGRIGRAMLRIAQDRPDIEIVAINNRGGDAEMLAHLFKYDSLMGEFKGEVSTDNGYLVVNDSRIRITHETDPIVLPWQAYEVELAIEATGVFSDREGAARHLRAGAKRVLITAPGKDADFTLVCGVNDVSYEPDEHIVVSGASCTTNCLAPVIKVLHEAFTIESGLLTTVHAYTRDQAVLDGTHRDPRRARSAALNLVPTKTGAAKAIADVIPELEGRFVGLAVRVPVPDVSLVDFSVQLGTDATAEDVNAAFDAAAANDLVGILGTSAEPLVSMDFLGDSRSAIVDLLSTQVTRGSHFKVLAWYDNEWGYACRMVDSIEFLSRGTQPWRDPAPMATAGSSE